MKIKFIYLIVLSASALELSNAAEQESHNELWGARSGRDVLLSREIVTDTAKALRVLSDDYEFRQKPPRFPFARTITQIVVTDHYTNDNGGHATLKEGGPSTDYAKIHLRSERGHGYKFTIDIYGQ